MKIIIALILFVTSLYFSIKDTAYLNIVGSYWNQIRTEKLPSSQNYNISSGTGFYVAPNYIITNAHVVSKCRNFAIRGAVFPELAKLVNIDKKADLAILQTKNTPKNFPSLNRIFDESIKNLEILIAGYPLERGNTGKFIIRKGNITNAIIKRDDNFTTISFNNIVDYGSSGSPIIDLEGNLVGIVTSKIVCNYNQRKVNNFLMNNSSFSDSAICKGGLGVGLDGILMFLSQNNINLNYNVNSLKKEKLENNIEKYLVNIHCVE